MKITYITIVIFLLAPSISAAEPLSFYVSAGPKYFTKETTSVSFDVSPSIFATGVDASTTIETDDAIGIEGSFGVRKNNFRLGLVVDHFSSDASTSLTSDNNNFFQVTQFGNASSPYKKVSALFELGYALENQSIFTPYFAGRAGLSHIDYARSDVGALSTRRDSDVVAIGAAERFDIFRLANISIDDTALRYGGIAGVEIKLNDNLGFYLQGEYSRTSHVAINIDGVATAIFRFTFDTGFPQPPSPTEEITAVRQISFSGFSTTVGFRFTF